MGSPNFAIPGLKALISSDFFSIMAVFTQPDKAKGRKKRIMVSDVKKLAIENKIKVYQPEKIKTEIKLIESLKPDLIIVIAYGQIIPESILNIPKYGCFNVHASLLPKYRGASCLSAPILNNDKETGITIMKMDAGLDTGNILSQAKIKLTGQETGQDLHDILSIIGAKILVPTLKDFINGKITEKKQNENEASYVKITKKEAGKINWQEAAFLIERKIRAYYPWPGTYCFLNNKLLKIHQAKVNNEKLNLKPGEITIKEKEIIVGTGQANLTILKLQLANQKAMSAKDFINGQQINNQILK